MTAHKIEK